MKTRLALLALAAPPLCALAHEGHGQPGAFHWHPTDALGFALALAIVAGMVWWSRRK
jgi:hypothetical protein